MPLPSPNKRKPTAAEAVEWALYIAKNKITIDIDQRHGGQCWDLPNKLTKMYWGFFTEGNANAMANKDNYKGYDFKIFKNTPDFVPQIGDWAVWAKYNPGHVAIVVGPANKQYFYSVDQNWYTNNWNGSPPYKVKHTYNDGPGGVTHFVRPPYHKENTKTPDTNNNVENSASEVKKEKPQFIWKDVKNIKYTITEGTNNFPEEILHSVVTGDLRKTKPDGILLKNSQSMASTISLYRNRNDDLNNVDYPHYYIDKNHIWSPRKLDYDVPNYPGLILIEICEDYSANNEQFLFNELFALNKCFEICEYYNLHFDANNIKLDKSVWRTMKEHLTLDIISKNFPNDDEYIKLTNKLISLYSKKDEILKSTPKEIITHSKIKVLDNNNVSDNSKSKIKGKDEGAVRIVTNKYSFVEALNAQMQKGNPMINIGNGWFSASRKQVSEAMNPTKIWGDSVQKYQMLDLGRYQGLSVEKIDSILKNKGKLNGQGKAFQEACKKYDVNEIYLIAHAFLESGNGTSNFASGRYGIYNFFGINAHDSNPNLAINYAKNKGWTTPAKGIHGGAKFIRENYLNKGKNTLYRMRWNPQNPGTLQYATDINWCKHQAKTIYDLYKKIGSKGIYYIQDKYK